MRRPALLPYRRRCGANQFIAGIYDDTDIAGFRMDLIAQKSEKPHFAFVTPISMCDAADGLPVRNR
jgi:hypothetical protein